MNINKILKEEIELINPSAEVFKNIEKTADKFCVDLRKKLRAKKIKAEVFIGGSLAKATLIKKKKYDVDVFVRFDKKYENKEISKLLGRVLGKARKIHGSRDYYQLIINGIVIEVVPVLKIAKPEQAENITDLSYFHINYIKNKIRKDKRLADEIMLAKTFCYAQDCYGAESYIHGFSGYALELLICYYRSFLRFVKVVADSGKEKIIIDDSKFYKNKNEVLRELNESKLQSPVILIDPTFKDRNALAGLSSETLEKFKKVCRDFLKKPCFGFFEKKNVFEELDKKYGKKLRVVCVKTSKQAGDIAGSKSRKFFGFFCGKLGREFDIKLKEFDYDEVKNIASYYFVLDKKGEEVVRGPGVSDAGNLKRFKKAHPKSFVKNKIAYAKIKHELNFEKFMKFFLKKYGKVVKEMRVKEVKLVE